MQTIDYIIVTAMAAVSVFGISAFIGFRYKEAKRYRKYLEWCDQQTPENHIKDLEIYLQEVEDLHLHYLTESTSAKNELEYYKKMLYKK